MVQGQPYYRMIRPFTTEVGCLKCHARQGYKAGDVRGGISMAVPMSPYFAAAHRQIAQVATGLGIIWLIGVGGLWAAIRAIRNRVREREQAEQERNSYVEKFQASSQQVKQLSGLLPICSHCKKIRDDQGYWNQIENYFHEHSNAQFTHSICQECAREYYPDMDLYDEETKE